MSSFRRLTFTSLFIILSACHLIPQPTQPAVPVPTASPPPSLPISSPSPDITSIPSPAALPLPEYSASPTSYPAIETPTAINVTAFPSPDAYVWRLVATGLDNPVGLANAADGSGRLFIIEQHGVIRVLMDGALNSEPFLDIRDKVDCCGERGLLGLAFHPRYAENGYFYVNYTTIQNGELHTVISRFTVSANSGWADPASEMRLLLIPQPYENHNGGGLAFGPEGYLYIGLGDGGAAGDPQDNAQSLDTLLGKLLRIDVDGSQPYAIPPDNPFASGGGLPEIWAYGLRNPWRFSFDRLTGDLYIGDVGQGDWEEIDFLPAFHPGGVNLGWDFFEGSQPYEGSPVADLSFTFPVAEYSHSEGSSVTAGFVYRGVNLPAWQGVYLYGDFSAGRVWGLLHLLDGVWQSSLLFETGALITSFGEDEEGEIYLVDYAGRIFRLDQ